MSKHTPGPWKIKKGFEPTPAVRRIVSGNVPICSLTERWYEDIGKDEADANARLITAAPDLLYTLEQVAAWITIDPVFVSWPAAQSYLGQINDIIAKVKDERINPCTNQ